MPEGKYSGDNLKIWRQFEATIWEKSLFCKLLPTIAASNCCQQLLPAICSTETYYS
jgi:hypothetical protein